MAGPKKVPTASRPATAKLNAKLAKSKDKAPLVAEMKPNMLYRSLKIKLAKSMDKVPLFAEMKPNVLYRPLNKSFPFCDMLYLKASKKKKKLVCVQVSIEAKGKRKVELGVFSKFCERLGWGPTPSPEQLALIEYVYCPLPSLADSAAVTFDEGVGISQNSVWRVDPNFAAKMSNDVE